MSDTLPFSEVKAYLSEVADRVEREHDRILVTRNGRPSFVLLSPTTSPRWRSRSTSSRTTS
jgi:antitoxin YefM